MRDLLDRYSAKLVRQGLCEEGEPLLAGLDADLVWNRDDPAAETLEEVIRRLDINSLLFARPAEPYLSMMNVLAEAALGGGSAAAPRTEPPANLLPAIRPEDSETRTFLHDIPIAGSLDADAVVRALRHRKAVVVPHTGIVTFGTVSPEQAFVTFSSICFACFVKFCVDAALSRLCGAPGVDRPLKRAVSLTRSSLERAAELGRRLETGPFASDGLIVRAVAAAGEATVRAGLVDSYFGNVSYRSAETIYISQTGSSLDELAGCIDPCPLDGSSCVGLTASSELSAHRDIYARTDRRAILHGHPKFSVIVSMLCDEPDCPYRGRCHRECPKTRWVGDVPIVPGEVGTGRFGLSRTLPPAVEGRRGAVVYGHGLFTLGAIDFTDAFANLVDIEAMCLERFLIRV